MIFNCKDQDPYIEKDHDLDLDLPRSPTWSWSDKIRWTMIFDLDLQDHLKWSWSSRSFKMILIFDLDQLFGDLPELCRGGPYVSEGDLEGCVYPHGQPGVSRTRERATLPNAFWDIRYWILRSNARSACSSHLTRASDNINYTMTQFPRRFSRF